MSTTTKTRLSAAAALALINEPQSEAELRGKIKDYLVQKGFQCKSLSTSKRLHRQLTNLADFEVRHPSWEPGRFVRVEVKFGAGRWHWSSPEQELDYREGRILVWWWFSDCQDWVSHQTID